MKSTPGADKIWCRWDPGRGTVRQPHQAWNLPVCVSVHVCVSVCQGVCLCVYVFWYFLMWICILKYEHGVTGSQSVLYYNWQNNEMWLFDASHPHGLDALLITTKHLHFHKTTVIFSANSLLSCLLFLESHYVIIHFFSLVKRLSIFLSFCRSSNKGQTCFTKDSYIWFHYIGLYFLLQF